MSGIFDEKNMMQALERYLPAGERIQAGIHGIGIETEIRQIFGKCVLLDDKIFPATHGTALEVRKSKYSKFDVYIGITEQYLILAECEVYKHLYEFDDDPDLEGIVVEELQECIPIEDIGTCFLLEDIKRCVIKKGWMGSVNCGITMKNGSSLKLMLPKRGGMGGGMPRHQEYRDAIIARLGKRG